ncbi:hypothetical protein FRB93_009875 [Tulasnella sp. JGI-2019a]|nr:hypothetical protein FRB93_009875 [Tulasnella sp. JGI-2019a]
MATLPVTAEVSWVDRVLNMSSNCPVKYLYPQVLIIHHPQNPDPTSDYLQQSMMHNISAILHNVGVSDSGVSHIIALTEPLPQFTCHLGEEV